MLAIIKCMSSKINPYWITTKKLHKLDEFKKLKIFNRGIGIAEKTYKTRRVG